MEEVWGNISLPSLHNPTSTTKPPSLGALSSGTNFYDFFNNADPYSDQQRLANYPKTNSSSSINQMGFVENPSSSSLVKKRAPNNEDESANDRRRLRLIKNRESADRSRARRQVFLQLHTQLHTVLTPFKNKHVCYAFFHQFSWSHSILLLACISCALFSFSWTSYASFYFYHFVHFIHFITFLGRLLLIWSTWSTLQAYTNELEQEIENLKKENARLRQQLQKAKPEMVKPNKIYLSICSSSLM